MSDDAIIIDTCAHKYVQCFIQRSERYGPIPTDFCKADKGFYGPYLFQQLGYLLLVTHLKKCLEMLDIQVVANMEKAALDDEKNNDLFFVDKKDRIAEYVYDIVSL